MSRNSDVDRVVLLPENSPQALLIGIKSLIYLHQTLKYNKLCQVLDIPEPVGGGVVAND